MARQRHWVNRGTGGECVFITTTVLDFVHAFRRESVSSAMVGVTFRECRRAGAILHAYVIMPNHIHLLVRLPLHLTSPQFMRSFKPRTSSAIRSLLQPDELAQFSDQSGLNRNTFWQRSFRGIVIEDERNFATKVHYIHQNPVRAGYVQDASDYSWSSASQWALGQWDEERGLPLVASGLQSDDNRAR